MNKRNLKIIITIIAIIVVIAGGVYLLNRNKEEKVTDVSNYKNQNENKNNTTDNKLSLLLSLEDKITDNSAWCGTFNLIWNDLKNDLAKQDIEFEPQLEVAKNLNRGTFNTSYLSEESYYKTYGIPSLELKEKIEKAIKEKFNETSNILNDFNWERANQKEDYFLYAMLKKEFEFPKEFTKLENGKFGQYDNVEYFGINSNTAEEVREQVRVLYYNSKDDFAIKLVTKDKDEVIISKGNNQETFKEMYEEINRKSQEYDGITEFSNSDTLKIPNMKFDLKEEIKDIENKGFKFSNGETYRIEKALQTIKFELDKKGGKVISEAGMMVNKEAILVTPLETPKREFNVDDTFSIFLKEKGKDLPYFASKISNITNIQDDVTQSGEVFYGKIIEAKENSIIVEPNEGEEIRKIADKIVIKLPDNNDMLYTVGTNIKITHTGFIKETYPAQIDLIGIELKSVEDFELQVASGLIETTDGKPYKILDRTEIENQDYDIYCYNVSVNIKINGEQMRLREALLNGKITMNEIVAKANQDAEAGIIESDMYKDGGSMIYKYDNYTIIKCHSLDGNRDVYIGEPEMTLNDVI